MAKFVIFSGSGEEFSVLVQPTNSGKCLSNQLVSNADIHVSFSNDFQVFYFHTKEVLLDNRQWILLKDLTSLENDQGKYLCHALAAFWPNFPTSSIKLNGILLPQKFRPINFNNQSQVTFYGGSFWPIHQGHLECVKQCPDKNLIIIPDYNPQKQKQNPSCFFSYYLNLIEKFNCPIYPGYCGIDLPNPTSVWIQKINHQCIYWLMGSDSFEQLASWIEWKKFIAKISGLYVVPRNINQSKFNQMKDEIAKINKSLIVEVLSTHPYESVSSKAMRS